MAEQTGTYEYGTGDLEGLALYLLQRAQSVKRRPQREMFERYASVAQNAADRIVKLENKVRSK